MRNPKLRTFIGAIVLTVMGLSASYSLNLFGVRDSLPPPAVREQAQN